MNHQPAPAVSVIICTRRPARLLPRAIESVLAQNFDDFEIIVVDLNGDLPAELLPSQSDLVRLIRIQNENIGAGRSTGLRAARGEFSAYCDDDGTWEPDHLSTLVNYLREHPDVDLVYGDSVREREGSTN